MEKRLLHIYGPVPSRRLGRSLGIDLVPLKTCTYDCVYCQLGRTTKKTLERREYVTVAEVLSELESKLDCPDRLDYISLAGSGEPTLNSEIGNLILGIKSKTDIPVAVLTNGSLLWMSHVQDALMPADLVLPSLDAGDRQLFQYVNRPHKDISFEQMVDGLAGFAQRYKGEIWLEVFLLAGVTGIPNEAEKISSIIRRIRPTRIQMNTAVRPPAESCASPLTRNQMLALKGIFSGAVDIISDIELGDWDKRPNFDSARNDILSLISRRPCTSTDIARSLGLNASETLKQLDELMMAGEAATLRVRKKTFYAAKKSIDPLKA
jgi:wyosine [tRNA(Phe)-imidazoG37] synthetase (radical SAM superfamily)